MANTKAISELNTKPTAHMGDLFEVAVEDAQSASGYSSGKMTAEVMAEGMLNSYTYPSAMPNMQGRTITGAINTLLGNFANVYDNTATYSVGDVVTYNGQLYKCDTAIDTAEEFDSEKWDAGTMADFFEGGGGQGFDSKLGLVYRNTSAALNGYTYTVETAGLYVIQFLGAGTTVSVNLACSGTEVERWEWTDSDSYRKVIELIYNCEVGDTITATYDVSLSGTWSPHASFTTYRLYANAIKSVISRQVDNDTTVTFTRTPTTTEMALVLMASLSNQTNVQTIPINTYSLIALLDNSTSGIYGYGGIVAGSDEWSCSNQTYMWGLNTISVYLIE